MKKYRFCIISGLIYLFVAAFTISLLSAKQNTDPVEQTSDAAYHSSDTKNTPVKDVSADKNPAHTKVTPESADNPQDEDTSQPPVTPQTETADKTESPDAQETASETTVLNITATYDSTDGALNLRENPSMDAAILQTISAGAELKIRSFVDDTWAFVQYNDNEYYCAYEYLTFEKN